LFWKSPTVYEHQQQLLQPQAGVQRPGACQARVGGRVHSRFEERWGVGDTMGKVVVHRPGGGRGVMHCDRFGKAWAGADKEAWWPVGLMVSESSTQGPPH
jgi:hypothetical protein